MAGGIFLGLSALGAVLYALSDSEQEATVRPPRRPAPPQPTPPQPPVIPAAWPPLPSPALPAVPTGAGGWPGSPERQQARVAELLGTMDAPEWALLTYGEAGQRVRIGVMAAPLSVQGRWQTVRPMESQWLADALGGVPLTPFVAWQMARHSVVPITPPLWHNKLTAAEVQAHTEALVIAKLHRSRKPGELVAGSWKWWVLSRRLWQWSKADPRSANFGLFARGPAFGPIQGVGTRHRLAHIDWSQLHQHMAAVCEIETPGGWLQQPTRDVLLNPERALRLCGLANHLYALRAEPTWGDVVGEGALPGSRHPFIPFWIPNHG